MVVEDLIFGTVVESGGGMLTEKQKGVYEYVDIRTTVAMFSSRIYVLSKRIRISRRRGLV